MASGIYKVKCLGIRMAEEGYVNIVNSTSYSFLVVFMDGSREIVECKANSDTAKILINYIDIDDSNTIASIQEDLRNIQKTVSRIE